MWSLVGTVPATVSFQPSSTALAPRVREHTRFRVLLLVLSFVAAALAFLLVQTKLHHDNQLAWYRFSLDRGMGGWVPAGRWASMRGVVATSLGPFLGLSLAGVALGLVGPRWAVPLPALLAVTGVWLVGLVPGLEATGWYSHPLQPIGQEWQVLGHDASVWRSAWFGSVVDAVLVLLPGLVAVRLWPGENRVTRSSIDDAGLVAAALAFAAAALLLIGAPKLYGELYEGEGSAVAHYAPLLVFGSVLRVPRRWWWLSVAAVPVVVGGPWILELAFGDWYGPDHWEVQAVAQYAVAVFAGASIRPMATMWRRAMDRPVTLLVACNVLNVADALLTAVGLDRGTVIESNPVIDRIGLLPKIAIVGIASALIYRARPRMLMWPTAVLAGVLVWHSVGYLAGNRFLWW